MSLEVFKTDSSNELKKGLPSILKGSGRDAKGRSLEENESEDSLLVRFFKLKLPETTYRSYADRKTNEKPSVTKADSAEEKRTPILKKISDAITKFFDWKPETQYKSYAEKKAKLNRAIVVGHKKIMPVVEQKKKSLPLTPAQTFFKQLSKESAMKGKALDVKDGKLEIVDKNAVVLNEEKVQEIKALLKEYSKRVNLGADGMNKENIAGNLGVFSLMLDDTEALDDLDELKKELGFE